MGELSIANIALENREALIDELMQQYGQDILQLVYSYVNNQTIAEDLTQDIFVKCYQSLSTYKGKSSLKTWLWRIAINHSKDYIKSWYNRRVLPTAYEALCENTRIESVEQTIIQQDADEQLSAAVMGLPVKYREVIYLFYFEELPIKEIAAVLEVNANTVKTRMRKGKDILKKRLEVNSWTTD